MNVTPNYLPQNGCDKAALPDALTSRDTFFSFSRSWINDHLQLFPKQAERSVTYWNVSKKVLFNSYRLTICRCSWILCWIFEFLRVKHCKTSEQETPSLPYLRYDETSIQFTVRRLRSSLLCVWMGQGIAWNIRLLLPLLNQVSWQ